MPANRIGHQAYLAAELKTMREIITMVVFSAFSILWLKESFTFGHVICFLLIATGQEMFFKA